MLVKEATGENTVILFVTCDGVVCSKSIISPFPVFSAVKETTGIYTLLFPSGTDFEKYGIRCNPISASLNMS